MKEYIKHDVDKNIFFIQGEVENKGQVTYTINNGVMNINGTFVDPDYRSHGYAKELVDAAVVYAKSKDLKLHPTCSYAVKVVERDYADLLAN